jgi:tryptophan synthase alpha chain
MSPSEKIGAAIRAKSSKGEAALVGYLTAGFPTRKDFVTNLREVASGCDVVEIGVPFSDPMADGATVQRASFKALADGVTLPWILEVLQGVKVETPLLLMSYLNPLLAFGLEKLPRAAAQANVAGFIVPDLPFEESDDLRTALESEGLALVQMVTPVTPPDRLKRLCQTAKGFIYAVTMTGTTGKAVEVPDEVLKYMQRVREVSKVPVCAGFGIRNRDQVSKLAPHVDGVVVGSALVETLERGENVKAFLHSLR